jgi:alpha-mannosidase
MSHKPVIYLVPHFHYDPVWLEDQRTYTAQAFDLVNHYLDAARQDPSFKFILSELDYLKPYWDAFPAQRALIRQLVAGGRLEINGGYNEPNETSIGGEALIRNLIYGRLFQQGVLGIAPRVYLPLDVFGHCPQLPQVLRQLGFAGCIYSKDIAGAEPLCRALALDGSGVIQKHEHYWFNPQSWEEFIANVVAGPDAAATGPQPPGLDADLRFIGTDMQPPPRWLLGRGRQLSQHDSDLRVGLPEEYLKAVEGLLAARAAALPVSSRDLAMYHPGTTVSRIELKIANRLAECALAVAERFCSIAWLLGAQYPHAALDKAWRLLLFGQHHDAITGTPCDLSFLDLMAMYREALEIAAQVNGDVLDALAGAIDTAPPRGEARCAVVVFNPLEWERTDVCRVRLRFDPPVAGFALREASRREPPCQLLWQRPEGEAIAEAEVLLVAQEVPALGYAVFHVVADARPPRAGELRETDRATIENEHYTVSAAASAGGGLISIFDKPARRQLLDLTRGHPGNELAALTEQPDRRQPAWTVWTTGAQAFTKDEAARVRVERGPVMERIIVEGGAPDCAGRRQEIALYAGVRRIDFLTELRGYCGAHQLFAATFPLALRGCVPVFEERFGAVARRRSAGVLDYRTYKGEALSGCALLPAQNWMELGNCLRVIARKAKGRVPAAISVGYSQIVTGAGEEARAAGERLMRALLARGITCSAFTDDPAAEADRAYATFRFRLAVGEDPAGTGKLLEAVPPDAREAAAKEVQKIGYAFVVAVEGPREAGEGAEAPAPRAGIPCLAIIARDAAAAAAAIDELAKDAADGVIGLPATANAVTAACPAPPDYGVALVNRGNIGMSVEDDGTAVVTLMHTTAWPDHPWGEGKLDRFFVPEHKDHRFFYALYGHAGDWRAGETTRRAYEFNQPLIARQCQPSKGRAPGAYRECLAAAGAHASADVGLPPRYSFFSVAPSNVFLSALKPCGYPLAMGGRRRSQHTKSLIARVYEGHGEAARAQLSSPLLGQAWQSDPLENREAALRAGGGQVAIDVAPYEIQTLEWSGPWGVAGAAARRDAAGERAQDEGGDHGAPLCPSSFGPQREAVQPLPMRYWEHNLGPAPIGNQPVTVIMEGAPAVGATTRFTLRVANAMAYEEAVGAVDMSVPQGWRVTPARVPFRVEAGGEQEFELAVIIPGDARPGYIRAQVEIDGQVHEELLAVGELKPIAAHARRVGGGFEVTVRNPNQERMNGRVDIITPLETWGAAVGDYALAGAQPAAQGFLLDAGAEATLSFALETLAAETPMLPDVSAQSPPGAPWAYARIACAGQVQYLRVE